MGAFKLAAKIAPWLMIGVIAYLIFTHVDWPSTLSTLRSISPAYVAMAVLANVVAAVTMPTLHFSAIQRARKLNYIIQAESINAKVLGYSTAFPTALVAAYKIAAFQGLFESHAKAIAYFVVGKMCSLIIAFTVLVGISYWSGRATNYANQHLSLIYLIAFVIAIAVAIILLVNIASFRASLYQIATKLLPTRISNAILNAQSLVDTRSWLTGLATQGLAFALTATGAMFLALAISPTFPIEAIFLGRAVTLIALLAPISIAGIGAREVSYLAILPLYSIAADDIAALILLLLLVQWIAGAIGFVYAIALNALIRNSR